MMRSLASLTLLALALPGLAGCMTSAAIQQRADVVKLDVEKARKSGAYRCSPEALARAEANLEFTENELRQGDFIRAGEHVNIAMENVKKALAESKDCGPKRVLIKKPKAPTVVQITKTDKDGDGILDDVDQCPEQPEDLDGFEDEDGCPDPDNDQDGVFDTEDLCPNTPGPVENQGCPVEDRDGDGIPDSADACPDEPEDKDGDRDTDGCPDLDLDSDGDGILDKTDACPADPEDKDAFEDEDGCPDVDNDKDGLLDTIDKCPNDAGPPENAGCPVMDRDGDGINDPEDKCPDEPGVPEEQGCPKKYSLIVVKKEKIEIKQQVHFATAKANILPDSYELLAQVADAIKSAKIKKVLIEGHTDSQGGDAYNMKLSQKRADSVRDHLIDKGGVDPAVLESVGFGETRPIESNKTAKGRALNRRTEFKIIER
jgi:outer membrane protein OmpA-like peptidoglycan-associated protein